MHLCLLYMENPICKHIIALALLLEAREVESRSEEENKEYQAHIYKLLYIQC